MYINHNCRKKNTHTHTNGRAMPHVSEIYRRPGRIITPSIADNFWIFHNHELMLRYGNKTNKCVWKYIFLHVGCILIVLAENIWNWTVILRLMLNCSILAKTPQSRNTSFQSILGIMYAGASRILTTALVLVCLDRQMYVCTRVPAGQRIIGYLS
jgi:hypothetical protein